MCGEKLHPFPLVMALIGSSPRVRGEILMGYLTFFLMGIIPACAGRSQQKQHGGCLGRDHPRVCGEKQATKRPCLRFAGSSPRVRGEGPRRMRGGLRPRIIPACAGRRQREACAPRPLQDHPRVCGEKGAKWRNRIAHQGSSPRVRGEVNIPRLAAWLKGIIPACAGRRLSEWNAMR